MGVTSELVQQQSPVPARLASSRHVPPDTKVSPDSEFAHPVWKMQALVSLPGVNNSMKYWDFRTVPGFPAGFALTLAEFAFSRLFKPVATHDRQGDWLTVYNELSILREVARFFSEQGCSDFCEVDNGLLERYLHLITRSDEEGERKSSDRARTVIFMIYRLWEYGPSLSNPIPSMPFGKPLRKLMKNTRSRGGRENKTPVIPEPVFEALMTAALDYVLKFSAVIIDAWVDLQNAWTTTIEPLELTDDSKFRKLSKVATQITAVKEASWLKKNWATYGDIYYELQQLRTACILTILAFSGIRPSELLSLEAKCSISEENSNGGTRHYINTTVHKHRDKGARDTWVVIEEVVKAINILEKLTERVHAATKDNRLLITDGASHFFSVQTDFTGASMSEYKTVTVLYHIDSFREHCNTGLNRPPIPEWMDEAGNLLQWKFNERQFRRTLARYIARQPFGVIAGMIQYKHVEVTIFEGYAGCEPEWNKMLSDEKVLASVDILEELAMDLSHGAVAGEFGSRLKDEFTVELRGRAEDFPPSQIAKWLANNKKTLFVGKFNFCFFDPAKALCTAELAQKDKPILNFCQPTRCANACVAKRHVPMWEAQLKQAEEFVECPKVPDFQLISLREEAAQLRGVVAEFRSEP